MLGYPAIGQTCSWWTATSFLGKHIAPHPPDIRRSIFRDSKWATQQLIVSNILKLSVQSGNHQPFHWLFASTIPRVWLGGALPFLMLQSQISTPCHAPWEPLAPGIEVELATEVAILGPIAATTFLTSTHGDTRWHTVTHGDSDSSLFLAHLEVASLAMIYHQVDHQVVSSLCQQITCADCARKVWHAVSPVSVDFTQFLLTPGSTCKCVKGLCCIMAVRPQVSPNTGWLIMLIVIRCYPGLIGSSQQIPNKPVIKTTYKSYNNQSTGDKKAICKGSQP